TLDPSTSQRASSLLSAPTLTGTDTLSLHDALPISLHGLTRVRQVTQDDAHIFVAEEQIEEEMDRVIGFVRELYEIFELEPRAERSEEHTCELQSRFDLVCRLLLEKKKKNRNHTDL